jgi:anti-sigma factor RsiW
VPRHGEPVASIVYKRRKHVINLFVAQRLGVEHANITGRMVQGYSVRHWAAGGLNYWAVSDLDPLELNEFLQKISTAFKWSDK